MSGERNHTVREFCFSWQIKKIFSTLECTKTICSKSIQVSAAHSIHFDVKYENHIIAFSISKDEEVKLELGDIEAHFDDGRAISSLTKQEKYDLPGWEFKFQTKLSASKLKDLASGNLFLKCHLFLGEPQIDENSTCEELDLIKLSRDMEKLYTTKQFYDLTLHTESDLFQVHESILSARAPHMLRKMKLSGDWFKESFSASELKVIFQYLYSGKVIPDNILLLPTSLFTTVRLLKIDYLKEKLCTFPNEVKMVTSQVETRTTLIWPVEGFSAMVPSSEYKKCSPILCSDVSDQFQLEICVEQINSMGFSGIEEEDINVSVRCHLKYLHVTIFIKSKTSVVDVFGELQHLHESENFLEKSSLHNNTSDWNLVYCVKKSVLTSDSAILLANDTLSLMFDFTIYSQDHKITESSFPDNSFQNFNLGIADSVRLSTDLKKLYLTGKKSDMTVCAKDRVFKVHKAVLWARVPKLINENDVLNLINMDDRDPNVIDAFLKYLYSGKLPDLTCGLAVKLYGMAYEFEITLLKRKCLTFVKENLVF